MPGTVRIVGAGLAGLTAAVILARGGRSVEVYEKKTRLLPSSGPHTEGIRNYGAIDALHELRTQGFELEPFGVVRPGRRSGPPAGPGPVAVAGPPSTPPPGTPSLTRH